MASRLKLHEELCKILGTKNVYFQSPGKQGMNYDAIKYDLSGKDILRANGKIYRKVNRYDGLVISYNPDCNIPDALLEHFEMCSLGKPYRADNLNHFPFTLYY